MVFLIVQMIYVKGRNMLKLLKIEANKQLDYEFNRLQGFCNRDDLVKEFVERALRKFETFDSLEYYKTSCLNTILYDLGCEIQDTDIFNSVKNLNSFIGNYFYDDSYYVITNGLVFDLESIEDFPLQSELTSLQGPKPLLELAKENAKRIFNHYEVKFKNKKGN